jgi:omega-6 fatty acid desaturase (delta-12 desaturase)
MVVSTPKVPESAELPFTLKDVRDAIPSHLVEASVTKSVYYIARDLLQMAAAVMVTHWLLTGVLKDASPIVRAAVWMLYAFVQGTTGFGLWVIAHECGHQAYFGARKTVNLIVGFTVHTLMLVPYHSWRITHATHHRYTNHIHKDTAFPPHRKAPPTAQLGLTDSRILSALLIPVWVSVGWVFYLFLNWEGQRYGRWANHFLPSSPMFKSSDRLDILVTDAGLIAVGALYGALIVQYGWAPFVLWFLLPWAVTHTWLVVVTLLQHTDEAVPHYNDQQWNFLVGALATVDRDYGIFNAWMHHITDAHVVHHLFSTMPFYNAVQATPYVARFLGKHYKHDNQGVIPALLRSWRHHSWSFREYQQLVEH